MFLHGNHSKILHVILTRWNHSSQLPNTHLYLYGNLSCIQKGCKYLLYTMGPSSFFNQKLYQVLAPGTSILPSGTLISRGPPTERSLLLGGKNSTLGNPDPDAPENKKRGTGCLLFCTVFSFILCWLPLYMIDVLYAYVPNFYINEHLKHFLITLRHINALILPYLYAYHLVGFKAALKKRCGGIWKRGGECE